MSDDIEIPIISICDGWDVDDIQTEDDCDDAFAVLTALVVSIEARMDDLEIAGNSVSVEYKKAKTALRWKKAALTVVQTKRGKIRRAEKEAKQAERDASILRYFEAMHPDLVLKADKHFEAGTTELAIAEAAE